MLKFRYHDQWTALVCVLACLRARASTACVMPKGASERHWSCSVMGFSRCCHRSTRPPAAWSMMIIICTTATGRERGGRQCRGRRRWTAKPFLAFLLPFPIPSGRPRNHGLLGWPSMARQTLFGKQVTILSGSIFLPLPFPPRATAKLSPFESICREKRSARNETKF